MYLTKQVTEDIVWVGGNDRRLAMFEGVYSVPTGVSYNSYLVLDDKTVLFDTVDRAVEKVFFENLEHTLSGRSLDYLVIQHMEPDHSASLSELLLRYPEVKIVCNAQIAKLVRQFTGKDYAASALIVKEGSTLETGRHSFRFLMAPMVHWPEVMMTYDSFSRALFTADAFGCFGATNGAMFADEVDFALDYMKEARRYYTNIVGKYGQQVQAVLKKAAALDIAMLCPLHGFVWRKDLDVILEKYDLWSRYEPEEKGVVIAYASVYGNTENAAEIVSARLRERGIKTVMYDVSVTAASEILAECFRFSHLIFASTTYNMGIFVTMDELLRDLAAHNLGNRTVALIENGSWAPQSGKLMREILAPLPDMHILDAKLTLRSALDESQEAQLAALVDAVAASFAPETASSDAESAEAAGVRYVCSICGYVHEGPLPEGFTCPVCGRDASFFKPEA